MRIKSATGSAGKRCIADAATGSAGERCIAHAATGSAGERCIAHAATGSALVEAIIILSIFLTTFTASFQAVSLLGAKIWLKHSLYEALKCHLRREVRCEQSFYRRTKILSWGKVQKLNLLPSFDRRMNLTVEGLVHWCNQKENMCKKDTLQIRLKASEKKIVALRP